MKHWRHQSLSLPVLVLALLALLLLAVLQYTWVGQISESARARMQASASAGATRFGEEFDRELARAYLSLQMDALTLRDEKWESFKRSYDTWRARAPYPQLIADIYIAEISRNGVLRLRKFDRSSGRFSPVPWPPDFVALQRSLGETYSTSRAEGEVIVGISPAPVNDNPPALVIPVSRPWLLGAPSAGAPDMIEADMVIGGSIFSARRSCRTCENGGPLFAYTIATLDRDYIRETFIPTLARRHLAADGDLNYSLTIVSQSDPQQIIYESDARAPRLAGSPDATASLLNVRIDDVNRLLLNSTITFAGNDARSWRISLGELDSASATEAGGRWRLLLTHRAGSLEAAVASLRARNLAVSFSTLLLLALALVMIIISTRRAQRLARQKVEFVAAISHELRTPLTVICSAGENLADGVIHNQERARQYGALIHSEGRRLTEMVEQVLEFAGAQSERVIYDRREIDPGWLVEHALALYQPQVAEHGFTLETAISPDLPSILADPAALQRSIHNLLSNALKYGGERRWLRVAAYVETSGRRPEVVISVEDAGPGIAPGDIAHIFEPFYRGRDALESQVHGSGLGLSLVKLTVEAHGGQVSVASEPGKGARFMLRLPCLPQGERRQVAAAT